MQKLYQEIQQAQKAFKAGLKTYKLLATDTYQLSFILDGWVTVQIQLDDTVITYEELFSYMIPTDEIYKIVAHKLQNMNDSLTYLMLDLT